MDIICIQECIFAVTSENGETFLYVAPTVSELPPLLPFGYRRVYHLHAGDKIVFTEVAADDVPYHKLLTMFPLYFAAGGEAEISTA